MSHKTASHAPELPPFLHALLHSAGREEASPVKLIDLSSEVFRVARSSEAIEDLQRPLTQIGFPCSTSRDWLVGLPDQPLAIQSNPDTGFFLFLPSLFVQESYRIKFGDDQLWGD